MTAFQLTLKLILFVAVGYAARKLRVIADGFDKMLSKFLMAVPVPCMIINSFNFDFSLQDLMNCPLLIFLALAALALIFALTQLFTRGMEPMLRKTVRFALLFTNFTLLGLPVVAELYGERGAFNYLIFTLPIRIVFYGGAPLLLGSGDEKPQPKQLLRQFLCAPVVAVFIGFFLYVTQLRLPPVLQSALTTLGSMASPLGLILCGVIIADAKWSGMLRYPSVFAVGICRTLVIPAVIVGVELAAGIDREIIRTTMYYFAMPVASFLPTFLLRYNPEALQARVVGGYMVVVSTLCSVATIPLWTLLLDKFL
ncbi:MAG: hypothetical protein E7472_05145 [Ruminococcaceae bacterium]|nr:hypothetical protein [Oscillospiraceae bacterium]